MGLQRRFPSIVGLAGLLFLLLWRLPALAQGGITRVHHRPLHSLQAEQSATIFANIDNAHLSKEIILYVRRIGTKEYQRLPFRRQTTNDIAFGAEIPGDLLVASGYIEYCIGSMDLSGKERWHFASPQTPHPVMVRGNQEARWRYALLQQNFGNRSRFQGNVDYVNFGNRTSTMGGTVMDAYWRADVNYTYRLLGWVYSIRLGAGLLLGQTYLRGINGMLVQIPDDARCAMQNRAATDCRVGLYYGFAELRFRFGRMVRLDVRPILGVGPESFDGGASGQLLIGYEPGTHVALGIEGITHIGVRGFVRLAWDTVPRLPMSFTIDVENFPNNDAMAMRLSLSAGYRFSRYFGVDLRGGYATRGWQIGGPTAGLSTIVEF